MTQLTPFFNGTTTNSSDNSEQRSLIDLWSKIEKKQKRNQNFSVKKETLFNQFKTTVLPLEQRNGQQVFDLVEFLVPFVARKSLSHYQREELLDWIEGKLSYLRSHPFLVDIDHDVLQNKLNDAVTAFMQSQNLEIDEQHIEHVRMDIERMFDGNMHLTDEEIIALIEEPSLLNDYIQHMHEELDEQEASADKNADQQHHDPFQDFFGHQTEDDDLQQHTSQDARQKNLDKLFKGGQLNKIYKRLASVLHPDKEQDPAKKEQKHIIMQQLSEARKNKDAYTLLQLYQTHINDGEFSFDAGTLRSIQTLLREKLHRLDDELHTEKSNNDMSTLVWRKFSERSKKLTEQNFKQHIAELEEIYHQQNMLMQENHTVTKIKKTLQQRIENSRAWLNTEPMDFMDMMNMMDPFK
jgi:hypothetical protein